MKEIWKNIIEDNNYMISNLGNVYSKRNKIILKPYKTRKGYLRIMLSNKKRYLIHRLVAQAFIPNPENAPQVNHIDGNKQNNSVYNLEWCTQSENMQHCLKTGLKIMPKGKEVYNAKTVLQYDINNNFIKEWDCIQDAQKELKLYHISECCYGKRNKCGNFIWKFKEEKYER